MRVLTVRQPWAQAMFIPNGKRKSIENRTWRPPAGGRIGIHAAKLLDRTGIEELDIDPSWIRDRSAVIGTVELVSWHQQGRTACAEHGCLTNRWAKFGRVNFGELPMWHWMLAQPRLFVTPIYATGRLGLWEPGPSLEHLMSIAEVQGS